MQEFSRTGSISLTSPAFLQAVDEKRSAIKTVLDTRLSTELPALFSGLSGIITFYAYYFKGNHSPTVRERLDLLINRLIDALEVIEINYSFERGLAGVGWCLQHLINIELIEPEYEENIRELDDAIFESLAADLRIKRYDFFTGILGKGRYFLERYQSDQSVKPYLEKLVDQLFSFVEQGEYGIYWQDFYGYKRTGKEVAATLGMAHGLAGILSFLSQVESSGALATSLEKEIKALSRSIRNGFVPALDSGYYPYHVVDGKAESNYETRMAWCHGDPGILLALMIAAKATNDREIMEHAVQHGLVISQRRDHDTIGIFDACLCHGSAGLAQIFRRLYHYSSEPTFLHTSNYWQQVTLDMADHEDGWAGFRVRTLDEDVEWIRSQGLLTGIAGIGLSLNSTLTDLNDWDRVLLMS